ncbi:hypothetical protein F5148DRAFT_1150248 [Russula earlei]|uniref:Uncharacterized protein n=1 Tax=Russula earlei TaxID=71964 RepID=A0ACC0U500_9AGAM|nr:hypothetical protein F5148DRAFT_1150248 [Russula earlei]
MRISFFLSTFCLAIGATPSFALNQDGEGLPKLSGPPMTYRLKMLRKEKPRALTIPTSEAKWVHVATICGQLRRTGRHSTLKFYSSECESASAARRGDDAGARRYGQRALGQGDDDEANASLVSARRRVAGARTMFHRPLQRSENWDERESTTGESIMTKKRRRWRRLVAQGMGEGDVTRGAVGRG